MIEIKSCLPYWHPRHLDCLNDQGTFVRRSGEDEVLENQKAASAYKQHHFVAALVHLVLHWKLHCFSGQTPIDLEIQGSVSQQAEEAAIKLISMGILNHQSCHLQSVPSLVCCMKCFVLPIEHYRRSC